MEIRKFIYKDVEREVLVTEESDTHLKGYDLSKLDADEKKEIWRTFAKDVDMSQKTEEEAAIEYQKLKEAMLAFRNFKKSEIK